MTPGQTVTRTFLTEISSAIQSADTMPVVEIVKDGVISSVPVSVTELRTGTYSFSFLIPLDFEIGANIQAIIKATIGGKETLEVVCVGEITNLNIILTEVISIGDKTIN